MDHRLHRCLPTRCGGTRICFATKFCGLAVSLGVYEKKDSCLDSASKERSVLGIKVTITQTFKVNRNPSSFALRLGMTSFQAYKRPSAILIWDLKS